MPHSFDFNDILIHKHKEEDDEWCTGTHCVHHVETTM